MEVKIGGKLVSMSNAQLIGQGNFAKVYKVYSQSDRCHLAVRFVQKTPQQMQDLVKEKNIVKELMKVDTPHILRINEIQQNDKYVLYVTEYCQGGSLWDFLNQQPNNKTGERICIEIALSIAKGLQIIHNHKITHRDLKPENILLAKKHNRKDMAPQIKIADFGLSTKEMIMDTFAGTKQYIAPEQARFNSYTNAVDVWALGIIIDEMLHGTVFFKGADQQQIFKRIMSDPYCVRDATIMQPIQTLLVSMLRKKPFQRPTIGHIISQLENILQLMSTVVRTPTKPKKQSFEAYKSPTTPITSPVVQFDDKLCRKHELPITHVFGKDTLCADCLAEDTEDIDDYLDSQAYINSILLKFKSSSEQQKPLNLEIKLSEQSISDMQKKLQYQFEKTKKCFQSILEDEVTYKDLADQIDKIKQCEQNLDAYQLQMLSEIHSKLWGAVQPQIQNYLDASLI